MRLQWKYALVINLTVLAVLVAFYFFDSIRMRQDMNALHALGAEQGAVLKKISENTILNTIVAELTTLQTFDPEHIDRVIFRLKQEHPDMQDVLNVQATLGNTRIRSSLHTSEGATDIYLDSDDRHQIETQGAKIDAMAGENATTLVLKYNVPPKRLEPPHLEPQIPLEEIPAEVWRMLLPKKFNIAPDTTVTVEQVPPDLAYQNALNLGKFPFELWRMFVANKIYLSPDATVTVAEESARWHITNTENGHIYKLWRQDDTFWIHMQNNTGYIRVLFDVPYIEKSIRSSLFRHAIFIVIVGVLLVILIGLTTNYLIMKPLGRMTNIIQNAETVDFTSVPQTYSADEIGKATSNLLRVFLQLKAAHSKRIAALGQFAAGVAHEIRNPLNSIGMTAQHLKSIFSQPEVTPEDIAEAKEFLDIVDKKIQELRQTSEQFLTLNRPRTLNLEPVNMNTLLDSVLSEFALLMEEANVQVIKQYAGELPDVQLDAMLMRQTIFNLIQNSIQAMPKGGRIYLTTFIEGTAAGFTIRDTGLGIPEEIQERIYDAYFTTKEENSGVGLGLAISHQIITAHQGKIELKSKVGMGTTFKITFPIKTESG